MIPTAKEFFKQKYKELNVTWKDGDIKHFRKEDVIIAIEFAKLHCIEQAKVISEKALIDRKPTGEGESSEAYKGVSFEGDLGYEDYIPVEYTIDSDSILNAYPLDNIK